MNNILILTIVLLSLSITVISYIQYHFLRIPATIFFTLLLTFLTLHQIILKLIYPGSSWFCRRMLENLYSSDMSIQLCEKTANINTFILLLLQRTHVSSSLSFSNPLVLIESFLNTVSSLKKLNRTQKDLSDLLTNLKESLKQIKLLINGTEEFSLYTWLEIEQGCSNVTTISLTEIDSINIAKNCVVLCKIINNLLISYNKNSNCCMNLLKWLFSDTIINIDYMRNDLFEMFECESYVVKNGKIFIDCLYIKSENPNGAVFLYCMPNAGYYEFLFYQSDWIEFYLSRGINLFVWNYRGYGRTNGYPDIKSLVQDGRCVMNFIKENIQFNKIGIHGESLGGCIATHIASECGCDFLICDRTFGSLSSIIYFRFGMFYYYMFKVLLISDIDSADAYLSVDCYKIITSDCSDHLIPELASLKNYVAFALINHSCLLSSYLRKKFQLSKPAIKWETGLNLIEALKYITENHESFNAAKEEVKVNLHTEQDEVHSKEALNKLFYFLSEIQVGGLKIINIPKMRLPFIQVHVWVMVLEIWGGKNIQENYTNLVRLIAELKVICESIKDEFEIWKRAGFVCSVLEELADDFLEKLKVSDDCEDMTSFSLKKAGGLISLKCGHAGNFNSYEKEVYEMKLTEAGII